MAKKSITGLTLNDTSLGWTTLRPGKQDVLEVVQQNEVTLEVPEPVEGEEAVGMEEALAETCKTISNPVILGMPTDRVLLRVVNLPSVEQEELEGMVDLQVDKFSPFPVEDMSVSWEVLETLGEERTRVLIAATQREHVESFGGLFQEAGLTPQAIDVSVMGWWWLLKAHEHVAEQGRHVILIVDHNYVAFIICQDGIPVVFRSLGGHIETDPSEMANDIAEEAAYTLTALEADWGGLTTARLSVWHWGPLPDGLMERLHEECGVVGETHSLDSLPSLHEGLVRRYLEQGGQAIDLVPDEWHEAERNRQSRKRTLVASAVVLGIWLIVVIGFFSGLKFQEHRVKSLENKVGELEPPAEKVRAIMAKVQELRDYGDRTQSGLECLREVSTLLPRGLDLTSFNFKKAKEISLRGVTAPNSVNLIYKFFEEIENSELFVSYSNQRISTIGSGARRKTQFTVNVHLREEEGADRL